MEKSNYYFISW